MRQELKQPVAYFFVISIVITLVLFIFPINLFDGEVVFVAAEQEVRESRPLSLSYFIGLGYDQSDMDVIKDFYLTTRGWITAFIFTLGIPGLIGYRIYLRRDLRK